MPIFEFRCDKCGHDFEELVSGETRVQCPSCGSDNAQRLMSACARRPRSGNNGEYAAPASGGCGSCMGGNCASCGH